MVGRDVLSRRFSVKVCPRNGRVAFVSEDHILISIPMGLIGVYIFVVGVLLPKQMQPQHIRSLAGNRDRAAKIGVLLCMIATFLNRVGF